VLKQLEFHYVPKHASWLNVVEIEISVRRGQCLDRRIGTRQRLESEILQRNTAHARIKWMFTTDKARTKTGSSIPAKSMSGAPNSESHNHCAGVLVRRERVTTAVACRNGDL
jgi:hypothetical protein